MTPTLLYVEDDPSQAQTVALLLRDCSGMDVQQAATVGDAKRLLVQAEERGDHLSLIVTDWRLDAGPDATFGSWSPGGMEIVEFAEKFEGLRTTPVIIHSAFDVSGELWGSTATMGPQGGLEGSLERMRRVHIVRKGEDLVGRVRGVLAENGHSLPPWPRPEALFVRSERLLHRAAVVLGNAKTVILVVLGMVAFLFGSRWLMPDAAPPVEAITIRVTPLYMLPDERSPANRALDPGTQLPIECFLSVGADLWLLSDEFGWLKGSHVSAPSSEDGEAPAAKGIQPC